MLKMNNKLSDSSISTSYDDSILKQGNHGSITIDDDSGNYDSDTTNENQ